MRQLSVLSTVISRIAARLSAALSFSNLYPASGKPSLDFPIHDRGELLTLEKAFDWLRDSYINVYTAVVEMISEDQNEPLPLDWAVLVEDWDHTYWIIWIFIVWMLWARDAEAFQHRHNSLSSWLSEMHR
jgi:hypothetical protein